MGIERLNPFDIETQLKSLDHWELNVFEHCIVKTWRFQNFKTAIAMLVKVSELAESQNHHPEMVSAYTQIRIKLWTHDAGGLTSKDFALARAIDGLVAQEFSN